MSAASGGRCERAAAIYIAVSTLLVVFDAPDNLKGAFFDNGFKPFGRQRGAWFREFAEITEEARELEYELAGVGLRPRWQPGRKRDPV
jgi:hypothetical protein